MIANTTKLNTPGASLSALAGVHAMTDVTGFGLAGHALEMARGSHHTVQLKMNQVPLLHGVRELAEQGMLTGASGRNWSAYGNEMNLAPERNAIDQALLSDLKPAAACWWPVTQHRSLKCWRYSSNTALPRRARWVKSRLPLPMAANCKFAKYRRLVAQIYTAPL